MWQKTRRQELIHINSAKMNQNEPAEGLKLHFMTENHDKLTRGKDESLPSKVPLKQCYFNIT